MATYTTNDGRTIDYSAPDGLRLLDCEIAMRLGYTSIYQHNVYSAGATYPEWVASKSGRFHSPVRKYTLDTDEAISLIEDGQTFTLVKHRDRFHAVVGSSTGYAAVPALAVCLAWLAHHDTQAEQDGARAAQTKGEA